jgi:Na+-transporting NADH:ubiquinone oxidoreductase subunit NqrD
MSQGSLAVLGMILNLMKRIDGKQKTAMKIGSVCMNFCCNTQLVTAITFVFNMQNFSRDTRKFTDILRKELEQSLCLMTQMQF